MPCYDSMISLQTFQDKLKFTKDLYSEWKKCCVHLRTFYMYPVRGSSSLESYPHSEMSTQGIILVLLFPFKSGRLLGFL